MKKYKKLIAVLLTLTLLALYAVPAAASETEAATEVEDTSDTATVESVKAVPVLIVEGNTVYVYASADGAWNSFQATVEFDTSYEVEEYGTVEAFTVDAATQAMGTAICNVTDDGRFICAAAYSDTSGVGVEYDGPAFYITFADTSTPIDITLYDEFSYALLTATVDGAEEAVTYAPDDATVEENAQLHEADVSSGTSTTNEVTSDDTDDTEETEETDSSRSVLPIVVVVIVVVLVIVAVIVSRKSGTQDEETQDETNEQKDSDEE